MNEVLHELAPGASPRETQWALWGFALGFAANAVVAKVAQMTASAPMSDLVIPLLVGGSIAGATAAAIGWGLARLRDG